MRRSSDLLALNDLTETQWKEINSYIEKKADTKQYDNVAHYFISGFLDWLKDNDKYIRTDDALTEEEANTLH